MREETAKSEAGDSREKEPPVPPPFMSHDGRQIFSSWGAGIPVTTCLNSHFIRHATLYLCMCSSRSRPGRQPPSLGRPNRASIMATYYPRPPAHTHPTQWRFDIPTLPQALGAAHTRLESPILSNADLSTKQNSMLGTLLTPRSGTAPFFDRVPTLLSMHKFETNYFLSFPKGVLTSLKAVKLDDYPHIYHDWFGRSK